MAASCRKCGADLPPFRGVGRPREHCESCRPSVRLNPRTPLGQRECESCRSAFLPTTSAQRFCCDTCRYRERDLRNRFPCASCGTPVWRGQDNRPIGLARCKKCQRGASYGANRAAYVPRKVRESVYARDGFACGICEGPVDMKLPTNDDWAPTLDHILPRSRGGDESPSNLRLAHRWCNTVRSNNDWLTLSDV